MRRSERRMLFAFITPVVLIYLILFLYPTIRTIQVSMFEMTSLSAALNKESFVGFKNYLSLIGNSLFLTGYGNVLKILFVGGACVFAIALFFANVLAWKMRGRKFWRAVIYLPNIITPVALVIMWTQYVFNNKFGMFYNIFSFLGLDSLASFAWLSKDMIFWSMLIAYGFGSVGYYMVLFMAAIEQIPLDYYECASIEGAGKISSFFKITLPLLRDTTKTAVMFWCIGSLNFFVWSAVFNVNMFDISTITPSTYMMGKAFGGMSSAGLDSSLNVGLSSAIGIVLTMSVVVVFLLINLIFKRDKIEY